MTPPLTLRLSRSQWARALWLAAAVGIGSACVTGCSAPRGAQPGPSAGIEPSPPVAGTRTPGTPAEVRYLANEGFLIEVGGQRVLIDGLFGPGIAGYAAVPPDLRVEIEAGTGDWAGIRVVVASHFHRDHFEAGAVARFLEANPEAIFVSTPQAIRALTETLATGAAVTNSNRIQLLTRVRSLLPPEGSMQSVEIDGITIEALNLHHGRREPPVENLGLIITVGGRRFLHFGDTEAKMETFEPYLERLHGADVALLPFWFLSSDWRAEMVRDRIQPRSIVVAHLPEPDAPDGYFGRWKSHDQLVQTIVDAFPKAHVPVASGETIQLEAN